MASQPNTASGTGAGLGTLPERLAIAGSGAIACGLAKLAAARGEVTVWARSDDGEDRIKRKVGEAVKVVRDLDGLADSTLVVEAVVEDIDVKSDLLRQLGDALGGNAVIATTTSSLSVTELAAASGRPDRFAGLHVFNPVEKMHLAELAFPAGATDHVRRRVHALCEALGKTVVEVPDVPGFVVNRLLFPYLFAAVELMEDQGLAPEAVDTCMTLGASHPMGPLELLDFVGLDVAAAIGDSLGIAVPRRVRDLIAGGRLGRKSGAGFYSY